MQIPQVLLVGLLMLGLGFHLANDGETTRYSFMSQLLGVSIELALLFWGGFFS